MPEATEHTLVNPDVRHETSDVDVRAILGFGAGLLGLAVVIHLGLAWLFNLFAAMERKSAVALPPLARRERVVLPRDLDRIAGPRLQESEERDLQRLRRDEDARLNHYGWVDRGAQRVQIPIDAAMERMAEPDFAARHGIRVRPAEVSKQMKEREQPQPARSLDEGDRR